MSGTVAVTTGQPIVVPGADAGGWMRVAIGGQPVREVRFVLYNADDIDTASMIFEAAEEVVNGVAVHSELIEKDVAITAAPGEQKTYSIRNCSHPYVRLSAAGPDPTFPSTSVQGGIEVIQ